MSDPISLLIWLIVVVVVLWLLFYVLNQVAMPQPIRVVITVVVALVLLLWLLNQTGIMAIL